MHRTVAKSRPGQVLAFQQPHPLNCLLLAIGRRSWSGSLGSLPRRVVWINFQGSQCPLPSGWHKLCVLSHHPVTSSPDFILDGNFTLGKHGLKYASQGLKHASKQHLIAKSCSRWSVSPWLGLELLDLCRGLRWASSPFPGMACGLGPAMEAFSPLATALTWRWAYNPSHM